MGLAKKKTDPLSDRARSLNNEIAALEAEIKKLSSQVQTPAGPKFRSTATPHAPSPAPPKPSPPPPAEPVFEDVRRNTVAAPAAEVPEMFNEMGGRKYDLPSLLQRLGSRFRSPPTSNPRLINYLAAGGVQGLRPLRYEKRVARERFIVLVIGVLVVLSGLLYLIVLHH